MVTVCTFRTPRLQASPFPIITTPSPRASSYSCTAPATPTYFTHLHGVECGEWHASQWKGGEVQGDDGDAGWGSERADLVEDQKKKDGGTKRRIRGLRGWWGWGAWTWMWTTVLAGICVEVFHSLNQPWPSAVASISSTLNSQTCIQEHIIFLSCMMNVWNEVIEEEKVYCMYVCTYGIA